MNREATAMIKTLTDVVAKLLAFFTKMSDVLNYAVTGYAKLEEKKEELDAKLAKYARYIVIGAITGGIALILFLIIRGIVKKCKKCKEKRLKKKLEKQLALEV